MQVPKCFNRNNAILICGTDTCIHPNPFICNGCQNNQCKIRHKNCIITTDWNNFKTNLEKSIIPPSADFTKLSKSVQEIILKLIKNLQQQLQYFHVWKSTYGMPEEAVKLFQCILANQENKFTGKDIAKILEKIKKQKQIKKYNATIINNQIKQVMGKFEQLQKMIREFYDENSNTIGNMKTQPKKEQIKKYMTTNQFYQNRNLLNNQITKKQQPKKTLNFTLKPKSVDKKLNQKLIIKKNYLDDINSELMKLIESPKNLQLKFRVKIASTQEQFNQSNEYRMCAFQMIQGSQIINSQQKEFVNLLYRNCIQTSFIYLGYILIYKDVNYLIQSFQDHCSILINNKGSKSPYLSKLDIYLKQFATTLKKANLESLKTLTIYFPFTLGYDPNLTIYENQIIQALYGLSVQSIEIIADGIKQKDGYKILEKKAKISQKKGWVNNEKWQDPVS